jgi:hypothetical protein
LGPKQSFQVDVRWGGEAGQSYKGIVVKVRESLDAVRAKGMEGPLVQVLDGIVEWMEINTGVQETTANVVVDSYNRAVASPRKSTLQGK